MDPLDRIWLATAERVGLWVERTPDAFASTDGEGTLLLADGKSLDPDDSLAQMIFHEICHSLVEGEDSFGKRDWGLDNETERDVPREHACLRVQAALAGRHGLRRFFAPTTDFRSFYDALPADPFSPRLDPSTVLAILAMRRSDGPPWSPHLARALEATRIAVEQAASFASGPPRDGLLDLYAVVEAAPPGHPTGLFGAPQPGPERTCGTCAWRHGTRGLCRQAGEAAVRAEWPACERWEPLLDCQECGACCRAAYDLVQVSPRDLVRKKHPELVVKRGPFLEMVRAGDRCAALGGGDARRDGTFSPFACAIYEDRPRSCREFERGGGHCLTARRRVGLSL